MKAAARGVWVSNPLVYLFSMTWRYSIGNHKNVVRYWFMFIIANSVGLILEPLVLAMIMNIIQKEGVNHGNVWHICRLLLLPIAFDLFFWAFHGPARVMENVNGVKVRGNYSKHLVKGVLALPLSWHADHPSGETIDKIDKGTGALCDFASDSFLAISLIVQAIVCFTMLVIFSHIAGLIVSIMLAVVYLVITRFDRIIIKNYELINKAENAISSGVLDAIGNITTVIILRIEQRIFASVASKIEKPYEICSTTAIQNEIKWFFVSLCGTVTTASVMVSYLLASLSSKEGVLIGSVFLLFKYLDRMNQLMFSFCDMYSNIVRRKSKVMNSEEIASDFKEASQVDHVLPSDWRVIQVKNLNFSYIDDRKVKLHLENISMTVHRGERIAFIGTSGSGKTTLLQVLRGLYPVSKHFDLEVDGTDIPQGLDGIARSIALVPQVPELFNKSVTENITLGAECSIETVRHCTDLACFTEIGDALPKGFESLIHEKGVKLAGGERQRLALARGLLACYDKSLVLLDEPTSSVDMPTEMTIIRNIFREFPDKSIIASVHRLHLLPFFDVIYMFEKGRIIGHGNLQELLSTCPEFADVWNKHKDFDSSKDR